MRISKIGLRLGGASLHHSLHEYNEYSFGKGWTLVKGASGSGKTAIVNAISSVFECTNFISTYSYDLLFSDGGEIILDFYQDNSKVTVTKKWEGSDAPASQIYANGGFEESAIIVKPFITSLPHYSRNYSEHEIACIESLTQENPLVLEEVNSGLRRVGMYFQIELVNSEILFVRPDGRWVNVLATGDRLFARMAILSAIHKHTGAPLIFDDWWVGLSADNFSRFFKYLAMVKEECPEGQFIFTIFDYSDDLFLTRLLQPDSRYGIEDYIENVVTLPLMKKDDE